MKCPSTPRKTSSKKYLKIYWIEPTKLFSTPFRVRKHTVVSLKTHSPIRISEKKKRNFDAVCDLFNSGELNFARDDFKYI